MSKKNLADVLLSNPKEDKGKNMPTFINFTPNHTHQADLLFMPHDASELELRDSKVKARVNKNIDEATRTYKYVLVVVDIATYPCFRQGHTKKIRAQQTANQHANSANTSENEEVIIVP